MDVCIRNLHYCIKSEEFRASFYQKAGQLMQTSIPTFALYGEFLEQTTPDYLHYESIRERSLPHNWTIKPHRHNGLAQLFLFEMSGVRVQLGNRVFTTDQPAVLFVPDMIVHAFRFPHNMTGSVVSIAKGPLDQALLDIGLEMHLFAQPRFMTIGQSEFQEVHDLFENVGREFLGIRQWRNQALRSLIQCLLISIAREVGKGAEPAACFTRREETVRRFCSLVETYYTKDWTIETYAADLGTSRLQLNRDCRRILGKSPGEIIRSRRLIEAKRRLAFTQTPVSQVGEKLGFRDGAYFSRFFSRMTGMTPTEHRRRYGMNRLAKDPSADPGGPVGNF